MRNNVVNVVAVLFFMAMGTALRAGDGKPAAAAPPELYRQLIDCRAIADAAARLACYDRRVADLDAATQSRDIVIADKEQVKAAKRGLFGFAVPVGRLLGLGDDDSGNPAAAAADDIKRIDTRVASVGRARDGGWRIGFDEGGVWEQVDVKNFVMSPRVGQSAYIQKGMLGSFFVSVNGQPGIKFRRVE